MSSPKQPVPDAGATTFDPARAQRYARHLALPGFGVEAQQRLTNARVLVVGAGGLGAPVLAYLAAAGVGTLGVVDDDVVELSNLQRQVIHREAGVGRAKVDSASAFIGGLNHEVEVVTHPVRLEIDQVMEILPRYDLVVDGTDNFAARYLLNDACVLLGLPLVWASIAQFAGQLGVVEPGAGPCYRCLFPQPPGLGEVLNCSEGGVLGVLPGVMGALQATEVIKRITGVGQVLDDAVVLYDALTTSMTRLPLARDPECQACGDSPRITSLTDLGFDVPTADDDAPTDVREVRAGELADICPTGVLDVREEHERLAAPAASTHQLPWSTWSEDGRRERDLLTSLGSPGSFGSPGSDGPLVVLCASGRRSAAAASRLAAASLGADVRSLAGGVNGLDDAGRQRLAESVERVGRR